MKPTGDVECPPHIEHAHKIEDTMNNKAGSHDLDNEDIVDDDVIVEFILSFWLKKTYLPVEGTVNSIFDKRNLPTKSIS